MTEWIKLRLELIQLLNKVKLADDSDLHNNVRINIMILHLKEIIKHYEIHNNIEE